MLGDIGAKSDGNGVKSGKKGTMLGDKGVKITEIGVKLTEIGVKLTEIGAKLTEIGAIRVTNAKNRLILRFLKKENSMLYRWFYLMHMR